MVKTSSQEVMMDEAFFEPMSNNAKIIKNAYIVKQRK
jgi:hypothetical protein